MWLGDLLAQACLGFGRPEGGWAEALETWEQSMVERVGEDVPYAVHLTLLIMLFIGLIFALLS